MTDPQNHPESPSADPRLPEALTRDLTALYRPSVSIPPDLDAELRLAAQAKFDAAHRPIVLTRLRKAAGGLALAASLAIVAYVAWPTSHTQTPPSSGMLGKDLAMERGVSKLKSESNDAKAFDDLSRTAPTPAPLSAAAKPLPGDINADGRVDILDALALAIALRDGTIDPARRQLADLNGDGKVDQSDIDAIAKSAVSLASTSGKGGGQ